MGEVAAEYEINPNQLINWRREFLERAPLLFDKPKAIKAQQRTVREAEEEKNRLHQTIGQLTMERDYLQAVQAVQAKQKDTRRLL